MTYGQYNDMYARQQRQDALRGINATELRQHQIHDHDIGDELHRRSDGLPSRTNRSDNLQVRMLFEHGRNAIAHDSVIVDNQNSGRETHG
jgi:hypothetical protein